MSMIKRLPNQDSSLNPLASAGRRRFCQSAVSGVALMGAGLTPATATMGRARTLDLSKNHDLLLAMIKMRGSLDSELLIGWVRAKRFATSNGRIEPLCGLVAATFNRFTQKTQDLFEVTTFEIAHYTDFETGAVIDHLTMPFTNKKVEVPPFRFGPRKSRFAIRLDEKESFKPTAGTNEDEFGLAGSMLVTKSINFEATRHGNISLRHEEHARLVAAGSDTPNMFYKESTIWTAPAAEVLDSSARNVDASVAYSAMTSWRPWMEMGDFPGNTMSNGFGGKAASLADLPDDFLRYTKQRQPDVLEDPLAILDTIDD